eukprot:3644885-Karenia_brevis.AAC.2
MENVPSITHRLKKQRPAVEKICEDFNEMGYLFEHQILDSKKFLVPQRRNRVWMSAIKLPPNTPMEEFETIQSNCALNMRRHMLQMATDRHYSLESLINKTKDKYKEI